MVCVVRDATPTDSACCAPPDQACQVRGSQQKIDTQPADGGSADERFACALWDIHPRGV
jgi:hypothetical protein